ncbi:UNKNOWN [Stylonychia lemnae]|uniref:TLC domain-containing protein n=1 Tax=Stylonychia lemnae TaxID=5949 RepID=A0A078B4I5_STYLE|nr:UNKNOWN [Stylonychia lemnae]|eukprot:CDW88398.1 UNKNOWN [Stylonychia lemnae]
MPLKTYLIYTLTGLSLVWTANQCFKLKGYIDYLKEEAPDCMKPNPNRTELIIAAIMIQLCVQYPVQMLSRSLFMSSLPEKFPIGSSLRKEKAEMMAERVYKFFIYSVTSGGLFFVLKQSNFYHKLLWGDQEDPQYFSNYPCQKIPKYLDDIYILKLSYHVYELIYTMGFQISRRDFPEYIFHHIITLVLVLFSYSVNFLPIGAVIMLIHDFPDIFISLFKITYDIVSSKFQHILAAIMFPLWIYCRIFFFPVYMIAKYYEQAAHSDHYVIQNVFHILFWFLVGLLLLHCIWTNLIIKGIINRITNKKKDRVYLQGKDKID